MAGDGKCGQEFVNQPFMRDFIRVCTDGSELGWHESNGGNLSYVLTEGEADASRPHFFAGASQVDLGVRVPELAGLYIAVSGAGTHLCDMTDRPQQNIGIVEIGEDGDTYRLVWGYEGGGSPTSEFCAHVLCHAIDCIPGQVIYHTHCPGVIALSEQLGADEDAYRQALGSSSLPDPLAPGCLESLGVVPWMLPGSIRIAEASARQMRKLQRRALVWERHGLFVRADSFDEAFAATKAIEAAARGVQMIEPEPRSYDY